ncbi:MAG: hypothetical protein IID08_04250 [Candidatus Hydrogenedentes bacterium]|nr:hypothetical protein [Candidatus Hydrogenedentota bacterium]
MATVNCLKCKARPAIDSCVICRNPVCGECLVRCQVCKKTVCKTHHDVTTTGRKLCDNCMKRRAELRAERKARKKRERKPVPNLSFEALSEGEGAAEPESTSFEAETDESSRSSTDSPAQPTSYTPETDTVRLPVDVNRPILTASAKKRISKWAYIVPAIVALVVIYIVATQIFDAFSYF